MWQPPVWHGIKPAANIGTFSLDTEGGAGAVSSFVEFIMGFSPRFGVVLFALQLLLLTTCSVNHRPPLDTDHRLSPTADHSPNPAVNHRPPSVAELTDAVTNRRSRPRRKPRDCSDLRNGAPSGVYRILQGLRSSTAAYCDMSDGKGWTVIQSRKDVTRRQSFLRNWEAYKWGFGTLDQEFWWGLDHLWRLTSQLDRTYKLRIDLWDWSGQTRYAAYQDFTIASEADGYRLNFTQRRRRPRCSQWNEVLHHRPGE